REGPTKARSSASSWSSWPSRARIMTIRVTASLGSLLPDAALLRAFSLAGLRALVLRFGIVAGIVAQNAASASHMRASRASRGIAGQGPNLTVIEPCVAKDQAGIPYFARNDTPGRPVSCSANQGYCAASLRPALRLSKLRMVFKTIE